jgi:RNA polymerase sigma-70 factor (ECF subfamily)
MTAQFLVPAERDLPTRQLQRRKEHLVRAVALSAAPRHRLRLRFLAPAAGAAALATALAAVFVGVGTNGDGNAAAATALRDAAAIARQQPAPARLGRGEYLYVKSEDAYLSTTVISSELWFSVLVPHVREIWLGPDGGRIRQSSGEPRFLSERDREQWIAAGRPELREPAWEGSTEPAQSLDLPSDPDALYQRLEHDAAGHPEGVYEEMFTLVGDALRETSASPEQRAALYEVAARLPGVQLVGRVTDPAGRPGLAVAMTHPADGVRHALVFDPETSALLAEEQLALPGNEFGYPEGELIGYATYLETGVVDSVGERPRG